MNKRIREHRVRGYGTDIVVNEYWMLHNEPFHLILFIHKGIRYLIGKGIQESPNVSFLRQEHGYKKPSDDVIKEHFGVKE